NIMSRPSTPQGKPLWTQPPELGGYVAAEIDWFSGSEFRDDSGTRIRPQTLRLPQVYGGDKAARARPANLFGGPPLRGGSGPLSLAGRVVPFHHQQRRHGRALRRYVVLRDGAAPSRRVALGTRGDHPRHGRPPHRAAGSGTELRPAFRHLVDLRFRCRDR